MKISELNRGLSRPISPGASVGAVQAAPPSRFMEVMNGINQSNCTEALSAMGEEILRQGEVLARRYDIAELKRYKKLIAEFMQEAVRFTYEFKKRSTRDGRGRHHMYAIIRCVNEKLEKMTQDILSQQVDQLQLMADIEDIHGMLVDLLA
ncbi:MAG: YaaR family protein [Oscillospiraceae bacterium]|jgi:uncharacterized protein YaaR (DUF327 family)|nr:YaaR family protein [Oscillospiraceae bacterium]